MGNCFGKPAAKKDNFQGTGRRVGDGPVRPTAPTGGVGKSAPVGGSGRKLGESDGGSGTVEEQREARVRAIEARTTKPGTHKLERQLAAQKQKTRTELLAEASRENRLHREADRAVETRNWN